MQRRDHTQMRRPIIAPHFLMRVLTVQKNDRPPFAAFETIIDTVGLGLYFPLKIGIPWNTAAAWRANLNKCELALIAGMPLQKRLDSLEALDNTLGIVHTINAYTKESRFDSEFCDQGAAFFFGVDFFWSIGRLAGEVHANRERQHSGPVVATLDRKVFPVDPGLKYAIHRIEKVVAVRLNMKPDQIRAEQAIQQFSLPGADAKRFGIGPGDVPKDRNSRMRKPIFHHARQQGKMIVLNQDDGMLLARHFLHERVGKSLIDFVVERPVGCAKCWTGMRNVAQRPQSLVGETVVIALFFLGTEPYPA